MKVKELIEQLSKVSPDAEVYTGYDGNIVVSPTAEVEYITSEAQIGDCWFRVRVGDVVILAG